MVALTLASALLALSASAVTALNTIEVQGANFVDSVTKNRFEIIGMAYQPGGSDGFMPQNNVDPLSNGTQCLRDAILMQGLGINTIRVYNLDPTISHDDCASIFNAAGIYMLLDVNSPLPGQALDADDPSSSYDSSYLNRVFQVIEAFKSYDNLLGFFAGNEVINTVQTGNLDPPYIRAVVRDMKSYIAKNGGRTIPVGYSAADVRTILFDTWEYLSCAIDGNDDDVSRIDFFGLNSYSWCGGQATIESSTYSQLITGFANTSVPVFFSEFGCNKVEPRVFTEVAALYSSEMTSDFSGGIVYEWTQDTNDYGVVNINANGSVSLFEDYNNLQSEYNKIDIQEVDASNTTAEGVKPPTCASGLIQESGFANKWDLPNPPSGVQQMVDNGVTGAASPKMVTVSATAMPCAVYGNNSEPITGLTLKIESTANTPSNTTSSGAGATSSSAAMALGGAEVMSGSVGGLLAAILFGIGML